MQFPAWFGNVGCSNDCGKFHKELDSMAQPQLVVMAAGMGNRYGGLKQLDTFGPSGERVIDYALYDAMQAGFRRVVFVVRRDIETAFRDSIGRIIEPRVEVRYVCQELDSVPEWFRLPSERTKPWGTGHAILCAGDALDAPFAVINADDFYGRETFQVLYRWLAQQATGAGANLAGSMVGFVLENTLSEHGHVSRGICAVSPDGFLDSVVERTKIQRVDGTVRYGEETEGSWVTLPAGSIVSMNTWGFTPPFIGHLRERFDHFLRNLGTVPQKEYYLPSAVNDLVTEGAMRVAVLPTGEQWFGVTYEQDKENVRLALSRLVESNRYPQSLWA